MAHDLTGKALLMGFYGRRNFGDDAMAIALIDGLTRRGMKRIEVFCDSPRFLASKDVAIVPRKTTRLLGAIWRADILIQGGGTIFHDSYTGRALYRYWINLMLFAIIFGLARLCGTRVLVLGAGIGPIRSPVSRAICRLALGRANTILVRDIPSHREIRALLPSHPGIEVAHDLALLHTEPAQEAGAKDPVVMRIGISICDLGIFVSDGDPLAPWRAMAGALDGLVPVGSETQVELHFLSFYTGPARADDGAVSREVAALLPRFHCRFTDYDEDPQAFWATLAAMDFVMATRFHAVVAAFVADLPVLAISYNRKVADFCVEAGFRDDEVLSLDAARDPSAWLSRLPPFLEGRQDLSHRKPAAEFRRDMNAALDRIVATEAAA